MSVKILHIKRGGGEEGAHGQSEPPGKCATTGDSVTGLGALTHCKEPPHWGVSLPPEER